LERGRGDSPAVRDGFKGKLARFRTPIGDVEQNHCQINEGVVGIELRVEGPGVIPKSGVLNSDCASSFDLPGELVEFFYSDFLPVGKSLDLLNVTAEIANFVERVPGSHLELQLSLYIRDFH